MFMQAIAQPEGKAVFLSEFARICQELMITEKSHA
jgi:hypothetical protein